MTGLLYGVAAGLMAVSAVGGGLALLHRTPNLGALAGLMGFCIGAGWLADGVVDWVRLWRSDRLRERERLMALRERQAVLERAAALTPVRLTRLVPVNGGVRHLELPAERPARWLAWQRASEELLLWYLEVGALTVEALCGRGTRKAFSDRGAWGALLGEWARLGWARVENGKRTELLKTPDELRLLLTRGGVEWSLDADPPAIRPCPTAGDVLPARPPAESSANA